MSACLVLSCLVQVEGGGLRGWVRHCVGSGLFVVSETSKEILDWNTGLWAEEGRLGTTDVWDGVMARCIREVIGK